MRKKFFSCLLLLLTIVSCGDSSQYSAGYSSDVTSITNIQKDSLISKSTRGIKAKYVPGEVLVKFKTGTATSTIHGLHNAIRATKIKKIRHIGVHHIKLPHNMAVEEAVRHYKADPDVEYAEPNYIVKKTAIPNDPDFTNLWGLNNTGQSGGTVDADIDAPEAWDITTGSTDIIIAVIDTGVAYNHPDLSGNTWINKGETCDNGMDDDGNGYEDDCYGWDFINNDGNPEDYNGHGTHVAGTVAAKGNNGIGITGVMWSSQIMPVRFLGLRGAGDTAKAAGAIIYAADNGARIINASWGGGDYSQTLYNAIDYAGSKNILFVAVAGNGSNNNDTNPFYPASYNLSNIISVAATDYNDELAFFSNYGMTTVHLAAPGVNVYGSVPVLTYGSPIPVYSENFDGGYGDLPLLGWDRGGTNSTWAVTTGTGVGGTNSLEDSPSNNYQSNTDSWAAYMTPITSVKNYRYKLSFQWKGHVDPYTNDFLNINYSSDGAIWDWVDWRDGNTGGNFTPYFTYELTAAAELYDSFYFGFGLESDAFGNYDGVYIDDVVLTREPVDISDYSYESYDGTSMAASYVSGVAGLILALNPGLSYSQVRNIIFNSVDPIPTLSGITVTGGRVNAYSALLSVPPVAPSGLSATAVSSSQIDLSWTDNSSNEDGFKIERKTEGGTYSQIATAGANITTYSDTELSASTAYYYRVKAYNDAGDSLYSNEASATTQAPPSSGGGGGGGCFIATAAYGSYLAPEVNVLRKFRDDFLLSNPFGMAFVDFYYRTSPTIANYIARHEGLRALTRIALTPIVYGIRYPTLFIFGATFVLLTFIRRQS